MNLRQHPVVKAFLARNAFGIAMRVLAWYLLVCALLYSVQDRLIFHPGRMTQAEWDAQATRLGLKVLPETQALVAEPASVATSTVVLFHGNGENAIARSGIARHFTSRGHRIVMAEYPGFGAKPGTPGRAAMLEDGRRLLAQVRTLYPGPLQVWGESMGTGVASELAAEEMRAGRKVEKLVLVVPYDKLADVAQKNAPLFPVSLLLKHKFDNSRVLKDYPGEVAIAVADDDDVVGTEQGRQLRRNLAGLNGRYIEFAGRHMAWPIYVKAPLWDELMNGRSAGKLGD